MLSQGERAELCKAMLMDVLDALLKAEGLEGAFVVSPDAEALSIAKSAGAEPIREDEEAGVDRAAALAIKRCAELGAAALIIPSDVPLIEPRDVESMVRLASGGRAVVLAPSLRMDGTNALLMNPAGVIPTRYGSDSFKLHLAEASSRGIRAAIYASHRVMLDVDLPEDAAELARAPGSTRSQRMLRSVLGQ